MKTEKYELNEKQFHEFEKNLVTMPLKQNAKAQELLQRKSRWVSDPIAPAAQEQ